MKRTLKLGVLVSILMLAALACATFSSSGGDSTDSGADILYEDDFSNPDSGWDRYSDEEGYTDYENGAYKIAVNTDTMFYWANPYESFNDVIVEVQAQKVSGGDAVQYGIICRHQDVDNWYLLMITADGYGAIRKRYQGSDLEYILDETPVDSINTGNETNNLRAECVGSRLSLYVNGVLAVETNDSDITSGDVGLLAGTFDVPSTEVLFDNFVVRKP